MGIVVECEHVTKRYGDLIAVNDLSFRRVRGLLLYFTQGTGPAEV